MNITEIKSQVYRVIQYSQNIPDPKVDELLDEWLEAKRDFIEIMGGKLIYEYPEPVSFELGDKAKYLRIDDFICMLEDKWFNSDLASFVEANKDGFFINQVIEDYFYQDLVIPKGMKLLKAFKFFETDPIALHDIQSAASMIIQEDKVEGTLCFSVHPLDYLSSSENNHNWRSCHSLDGDYRAGNLSYMKDRSTVICYLKSKKMEKLRNFPDDILWNSKKWRVLLFFSESWNMIAAGRQYPFSTDIGLDFIKNNLMPKLGLSNESITWSPWIKEKVKMFKDEDFYIPLKASYVPDCSGRLIPLEELIIDEPGSLMFNDLLRSSFYEPVFTYRIKPTYFEIPIPKFYNTMPTKIRVGGAVKCCWCGKKNISLPQSFMCNDCEQEYGYGDSDLFATCPCCGNRFFADDGVYLDKEDGPICPDCAEKYTSICPDCGELTYNDNMIYDRHRKCMICKWCYADFEIEKTIEEKF